MAAFSYRALDASGKLIRGVIEADSERHVRNQLRARALKPVEVAPTASRGAAASGWRRLLRPRVSRRELALITRQLATLIEAGMPLDEVLDASARQARRPRLKGLMLQVRSKVVEGHTLAYALGDFPQVFGEMYRAMVRAGESAGFLGKVLERLAEHTENSQYTRQKLLVALVYPVILMVVAAVVVVGLMLFVIPDLVQLFVHTRSQLPALTERVIALSAFVGSYRFPLLLTLLALSAIALQRLLREPRRRRVWHRLLLRLPFVGELLRAMDTARFASTLSILTASGVPLLEGLRIAGEVMANLELRAASRSVATAVQEGGSLHRALASTGVFPPMMVQMVASGEASGELEAMLSRAALNQERELEMTLGSLMALMEPLMIVAMAVVVGVIVLAILLPIIEMNNLVA